MNNVAGPDLEVKQVRKSDFSSEMTPTWYFQRALSGIKIRLWFVLWQDQKTPSRIGVDEKKEVRDGEEKEERIKLENASKKH